jgi:alkylation response protein AidB-like acyl-CoA dehydrogenase
LTDAARKSTNFYFSDRILQHFLSSEISVVGLSFMHEKLVKTGAAAAQTMDELSLQADRNPPQLIRRDFYGEPLNKIRYHPAYQTLKKIALDSGMFQVKWAPEWRKRFSQERNTLSFSASFLFAMSECGLYCPLCMTDGVATLIDQYCEPSDVQRLLPRISTEDIDQMYTGAMFLTEKSGGSDVGANKVSAHKIKDSYYHLNGEKWFCSNADADLIFVLARCNPAIKGTKGLSVFLVEKTLTNGQLNPLGYIRLKNKLGVRSMASAECMMQNVVGKLVGEEGKGFAIMTDMINLSRLYNAVAALASMRRALVESYQFLKFRILFAKTALSHPLIRTKFYELAALYQANFYLSWHCIKLLDSSENKSSEATEILRFLTPLCKKTTAEQAVYLIRECMELMGGMGYIEDGVLPKILRDALVLPIWEGAGNIMVLDMLRVSATTQAVDLLIKEMKANFLTLATPQKTVVELALGQLEDSLETIKDSDQAVQEASAKPLFEKFAQLYQLSLMIRYKDPHSEQWLNPAIDFFVDQLRVPQSLKIIPPEQAIIENMLGWDIN